MKKLLLTVLFGCSLFAQGTVPTTQTWTSVSVAGPPIGNVWYDKSEYVPAGTGHTNPMHCFRGVYHDYMQVGYETQNAVACFDYRVNRWNIMQVGPSYHTQHSGEFGHTEGLFTYITTLDSIVYQADGSGAFQAEEYLGYLWQFDLAGRTTRNIQGARAAWQQNSVPDPSSAYDVAHDLLVMIQSGNLQMYTWSPSTNVWTLTTPTGSCPGPSNYNNGSMRYRTADQKIYVAMGSTGSGVSSDVWTIDASGSQPACTKLTTTCTGAACVGTHPPARMGHGWAYSTADDIFLLAGGGTGLTSGLMSDTWVFNPNTLAWTQMIPAATYTQGPQAINDKLTYDADSNVFVMMASGDNFAEGTYNVYATNIYVYPYSTALGYGRSTGTYQPTAGSLNVVDPTTTNASLCSSTGGKCQSAAMIPALAADSTTVYLGSVQTGSQFDISDAGLTRHPYIQKTTNGGSTWTALPAGNLATRAIAVDSENSGWVETGALKMALVGSTLWEAQEKISVYSVNYNYYGAAFAKRWTGSAWTGGAIGCFTGSCASVGGSEPAFRQSVFDIIDHAGNPAVALLEIDRCKPGSVCASGQQTREYNLVVGTSTDNGATWSAIGGNTRLNIGARGSRVVEAAMASDGTNLAVCFIEEVVATTLNNDPLVTTPNLHCKQWNGSAWSQWDSSTFNLSSTAYAHSVSMTYVGAKFYVAWTERTAAGVPKVNVCRYDGANTCTLLSGAGLNVNSTTGWAATPRIKNDGTNVYVAWEEQSNLGQHSLGYLKKYTVASGTWAQLGSAIAADATNGSVENIDLAISNGTPYAAWQETTYGTLPQLYMQALSTTPGCPTLAAITTTGVVNETSIPSKPGLGASWSDSTYSNCITRVTDSATLGTDHPVPIYSKLQAWNSAGTKILLTGPTGPYVIDASTYSLVRQLTAEATTDPRWIPNDPNYVIYTYGSALKKVNVNTGVTSVIRDFSVEYPGGFIQDIANEEMSRDGRWIVLIGRANGSNYTGSKIFPYDIINNVVGTTLDYLAPSGSGAGGACWTAMSPSGSYMVINWCGTTASAWTGTLAYSVPGMALQGRVAVGQSHSDIAIDSSGNEWFMQFAADAAAGSVTGPRVIRSKLPNGYDVGGSSYVSALALDPNYETHGHISCAGKGLDFCVLSSHNENATEDSNAWRVYEREIVKIYLDSTEVTPHIERVAHHYSHVPYMDASCSLISYWGQPHASPNRTGTTAIFGSTWGDSCVPEAYSVGLGGATSIFSPTSATKGVTTVKGAMTVK